jgi:hypothetical protein
VQTSDGGYVIVGLTGSFDAGNWDSWMIKTDATGSMVWNKTYGGSGYDAFTSIVETSDGGYLLAGYTDSLGAGHSDAYLVKTDDSGSMLWNATYGGPEDDGVWSIVQTSDGGYVLAGFSTSFGAGNSDFYLIKTDPSGNMQLNQTYGGIGYDYARSIIQANDEGYVMVGYTDSFGVGNLDFLLVKTDSSGGGLNDDYGRSLVQMRSGDYTLVGYTWSFGSGGRDSWLVGTDQNGNMQWNQAYGGPDDDGTNWIEKNSDEGIAIAGSFGYSGSVSNSEAWLIKFMDPVPGDVTGDYRVDAFDILSLSEVFGAVSGMPNWDPSCDTNCDNSVDVFDLFVVGKNFGIGD